MGKSYWKKEYDKKRKDNTVILCSRFSEAEAMWVYGEATNEKISVAEYIKRKVLEDYNKFSMGDVRENGSEATLL